MLLAPGHEGAMRDWVARDQPRLSRVRLHLVPLPAMGARADEPFEAQRDARLAAPDVRALARLAVVLKRFDHCILPVAPPSLAWARTALQEAHATLATPVLLLIHDMKAPAIEDLLNLGAADFMSPPCCLESLRVRLKRLTRHTSWRRAPGLLREPGVAYLSPEVPADAVEQAGQRPRVARHVVEQALSGLRHRNDRGSQEAFGLAKARIVDGFESEYIRQALSRHGGNVAQAARASSKHRRAFWALMRKHGISAAPYRRLSDDSQR
ncbi:helix-turn-helix domain-containing protein [Achromobacter pestifer]